MRDSRVHLRHDHLLGALVLNHHRRRLVDQLQNGSLIAISLNHLPLHSNEIEAWEVAFLGLDDSSAHDTL